VLFKFTITIRFVSPNQWGKSPLYCTMLSFSPTRGLEERCKLPQRVRSPANCYFLILLPFRCKLVTYFRRVFESLLKKRTKGHKPYRFFTESKGAQSGTKGAWLPLPPVIRALHGCDVYCDATGADESIKSPSSLVVLSSHDSSCVVLWSHASRSHRQQIITRYGRKYEQFFSETAKAYPYCSHYCGTR